MRPTWEEFAIRIAETAAMRSEDNHRKVGACALDKNNMILGVGYNGLAAGKEAPPLFWEKKNRDDRRKYMIHAEANCLSLLKQGEAKLLAVSYMPCSYCATMIASYRIPKVVYKNVYELDTQATKIFDFYDIELIKL